jgi:hypothetical protein
LRASRTASEAGVPEDGGPSYLVIFEEEVIFTWALDGGFFAYLSPSRIWSEMVVLLCGNSF